MEIRLDSANLCLAESRWDAGGTCKFSTELLVVTGGGDILESKKFFRPFQNTRAWIRRSASGRA